MLSRIQIRQFLSVVDTGNFTRAANALHIAQPSLSAGIAELERQLGTRLFVRERRRIRLTEAGNQLLPIARAIERQFHEAESQVGSLPVPARPIKIGILESISSCWLGSVFSRFAGPEPLELVEGGERELRSALANGSVDFAVTLTNSDTPTFTSEVLFKEDYCLALAEHHPLAGRGSISASQIAGETMIARRSCEILADTSRFFTDRGVRPRFSLRSANDDRAMAFVKAGLGVTVAPRSLMVEGVMMVDLEEFKRHRIVGLLIGPDWLRTHRSGHEILDLFRASAKDIRAATRG